MESAGRKQSLFKAKARWEIKADWQGVTTDEVILNSQEMSFLSSCDFKAFELKLFWVICTDLFEKYFNI